MEGNLTVSNKIFYDTKENCGGTLIAEDVVMTAAQ